jgi:cyclohexa-1,5-dienecarbonyl-CoA hydratase
MNDKTAQVTYEVRDDVAYLELAAPPLNVLSGQMMGEITALLKKAAADDSLKALAITADGKAFSAGADVGEHRPEEAAAMIGAFSAMFQRFGALEIPVVMAVDGAALGAGFELVMMADVLLATERAKFGQPEIRLGFFAPVGVAWLPRLVGHARALEITCSGRVYDAEAAREWGLVSRVVTSEGLDAALEETLKDFRKASPLVMRMNVRMIKRLEGQAFEDARIEAERVFLDELMKTDDVQEGIASFFEKRRPEWKNR